MTLPVLLHAAVPEISEDVVIDIMTRLPGEFDTAEDWLGPKLLQHAAKVGMPGQAAKLHTLLVAAVDRIREAAGGLTLEPARRQPDQLVFCLTGARDQRGKAQYHAMVRSFGHDFEERFTHRVTHVVEMYPGMTTRKVQQAREAGIPVISVAKMVIMASKKNA